MFNTFPAQASDETTSTTVSSGGDLGPLLKHSPLPGYYQSRDALYLEGYASLPRSSIRIPISASGGGANEKITLFNSNRSTIWTYGSSEIKLGVDKWVGFWMNENASLMYVFMVDQTGSPDTYYTFTIDVAGTIVEIGNDQPAQSFTEATTWANGSSVQPHGSGGFKILSNVDSGNGEYAILDSLGQFTTQPTDYYDAILDQNSLIEVGPFSPYETESGYIISDIKSAVDARLDLGITDKYLSLAVNVSRDTFIGHCSDGVGDSGVIRWRDYIVVVQLSGFREGLVKYSLSDFDKYASEMAEYYGVIE